MASQVNGTFQVHKEALKAYVQRVKDMTTSFIEVKIEHIPREQNERAAYYQN